MRRLLDSDPKRFADADAPTEQALDLLRAATPYEAPLGRKQRVRAALVARAPRRTSLLLLRPVVVIGVLVGCGAIASAGLGHWPSWVRRAYERLVPAATPVVVASAPREHRARRPRPSEAAVPVVEAPVEAPPAASLPPGLPARAGAFVPRAAAAHRHDAATQRLRPAPPADAREQTGPVLAAMQALRRDHDPVRARALLDAYLARHPNGALAEEALAISIEAAAAHHDRDAPDLASRYLARYPTGPFRSLARQVLAGAAD